MLRKSVCLSVFLVLVCRALPIYAQQAANADSVVPSMVKFSGTLSNTDGKPLPGTVGVTFLLYKEQTGGAPLWLENQNVQADKNGHYSVMLGSASAHGLPPEVFVAGEARWLGVQASGQAEQPRTLLLSVPYALKALDAETLGGKPASFFMSASGSGAGAGAKGLSEQAGPQVEQKNEIVCSSTTNCKTGFVPLFATNGGSAQVNDSIISQSGSNIAIVGGTESVTSSANTPAISGTSTGTSGYGVSGSGNTGVFGLGATYGLYGESSASNGAGIVGLNSAAGGVGMKGYISATSGGSHAVEGITLGNATGFYTDSNVQQARTMGGWVKAMVYSDSGSIVNCFNSTLSGAAATTPPCGFTFDKTGIGDYIINFGFQVDDRFFSTSIVNATAVDGHPVPYIAFYCTDKQISCKNPLDSSSAEITIIDTRDRSFNDQDFSLIVF